jgi:hypothetical protein
VSLKILMEKTMSKMSGGGDLSVFPMFSCMLDSLIITREVSGAEKQRTYLS